LNRPKSGEKTQMVALEGATVSPADYPIGSPASRAAARRLAAEKKPRQMFVERGEDGQLIREPGVRYADVLLVGPLRTLTPEEWKKRHPGGTEPTSHA
jgi:hypothetical protein